MSKAIKLNHDLAVSFLQKNNYHNFTIKKIAGDASFRSYYRIKIKNNSLILMYAPPKYENIEPFINIDKFLINNGFLAPEILAIDKNNGFLLLKDFGDISYAKFLITNPNEELRLYKMACDQLTKLNQISSDNIALDKYNNSVLCREVMLFIDWYLPYKKINFPLKKRQLYKKLWFKQFDLLQQNSSYIVLRDYHADNLMMVDIAGNDNVGLLDFQDALIGSNAYDILSLLEDARRDVSSKIVNEILDYYISSNNFNKENFITEYNIISLQRNIKILGIFARLSIRDGKDQYLKLLPRVEQHVINRLQSKDHDFNKLKDLIIKYL